MVGIRQLRRAPTTARTHLEGIQCKSPFRVVADFTTCTTGLLTFSDWAIHTNSPRVPKDGSPLALKPVLKARGVNCAFTFNGVDCGCQQFFSDESQTTVCNQIDCTNVEGGAFIDECKQFELSDSMSLLEILYYLPRVVCEGNSIDDRAAMPAESSSTTTTAPATLSSDEAIESGAGSEPSTGPPASQGNPSGTTADTPLATSTIGSNSNASPALSTRSSASTAGLSLLKYVAVYATASIIF
jgi:hypothetical protein